MTASAATTGDGLRCEVRHVSATGSTAVIRMTVLYPNGDDATFDWDYYTSKHMDLIQETWGPYVQRAETAKGVSALPKGDPAFLASAVIYFADHDALQAAMKAGGMDIPNDIPNFTNVRPTMQIDEVV